MTDLKLRLVDRWEEVVGGLRPPLKGRTAAALYSPAPVCCVHTCWDCWLAAVLWEAWAFLFCHCLSRSWCMTHSTGETCSEWESQW